LTYHIILGSRSLSKGNIAAGNLLQLPGIKGTLSVLELDVTSDASVDAAAKEVLQTYGRIDILVNNAGIFSRNPSPRDAFREILATNCVGALAVTDAFLPLLLIHPSPASIELITKRLIFVSSSVGSLSQASDPSSKYYNPGALEYRASKACLNMLVVMYNVRLAKQGILVIGADPGLCATDFLDREAVLKRGAVGEDVGGERIAVVVRGERDADIGRVCGEYGVSPW
jgi:NAD(P)-dependent dehydrogenase (short-subunit alcohol dehydrogenase family)